MDGLTEAERDPDYDPQRLLGRLAANLQSGRFRLVFAVDQLADELALIVSISRARCPRWT